MNRNNWFGGKAESFAAWHAQGPAFLASVFGRCCMPPPINNLYEAHQLVAAFTAGVKLGILLAECQAHKR